MSVRPPRCAAILVYCSVRDWTRFLHHRIKNIRIHPSTRYRIRCGFIFIHSGPVHTLSDSLRIYFFLLWRADLFFSGFAVEFAGYVWTVTVSGKKKLRIRKYPNTCGGGLRLGYHYYLVLAIVKDRCNHLQATARSSINSSDCKAICISETSENERRYCL